MLNNEMNAKSTAAITATDLVKMARALVDAQNIGDSNDSPVGNNVGKNQQWFRAGFKTGITTMCMAAMNAIPTVRGEAEPPYPVHGNDHLILSDIPWNVTRDGERKAGTLIDIESDVIYDLMLIPGELADVTWDEAKSSLTAAGGDLPSHYEMQALAKYLGTAAFENDAYWTNVKIKFDGDIEESVSYYLDGSSDFTELNDQMHARGVRRVAVDCAPTGGERGQFAALDASARQAADAAMAQAAVLQKLDGYMAASGYDDDHPWRREIAKVVPMRPAPASRGHGPDLSDLPEMQQLRAALLKPVPPVTARDVVEVLEQLDALATAGDQKNVCEFAIDVINGLMLSVDVERLA